MLKNPLGAFMALAAAVGVLGGCAATPIMQHASNLVKRQVTEQRNVSNSLKALPEPSVVRTVNEFFVNTTPMLVTHRRHQTLPAVFYKNITLERAGYVSLMNLASMITQETGVLIQFSPDVLDFGSSNSGSAVSAGISSRRGGASSFSAPLSAFSRTAEASSGMGSMMSSSPYEQAMWFHDFSYTNGDLKGLLNIIASRDDLSWKCSDGHVVFRRYITRTFVIAALAGEAKLNDSVHGANNSGGTTRSIAEVSASGGGTQAGSMTTNKSGDSTSISSDVSIWSGIKHSVKAMLSRSGKFYVSEAIGTITVTDTPSAVKRVREFIKATNKRLTRKVYISTQIYSVNLNASSEYGINWALVFQSLANKYNLKLSTPMLTAGLGTFAFTVNDPKGTAPWNATQAIAGALASSAHTTLRTSSAQTTLSGQPVTIQDTSNQGYIESVASTAVPNAGASTSIQQGTITTGFSLNVLPVVLDDDRVLLQTAMDLSTLDAMNTASSGGQTIQTPETSARDLLNRVALRSGETLIISGLEQVGGSDNRSGLLHPDPIEGGDRKGTTNRSALVVVITPVVVH